MSARAATRPDDAALLRAARDVLPRAHAPYSGFRVGAALGGADGRVVTGVNVESASFGLTLCAERAAAAAAVAQGVRDVATLALVTGGQGPAWPCGACRQVLLELFGDLRVVVQGAAGEPLEARLAELLPRPFELPTSRAQDSPAQDTNAP